ncbi:discoidin domain-containing protein [Polaribacter atrinae]|uniref:discoidin domain-containing protein n=1 Tax=Polaribacter atrinae TaxID=1333662 RepID=UPI0030F6F379
MRKILYTAIVALLLIGCDDSNDSNIAEPSDVVSVSAESRLGGALVKWDIPEDADYTYLEIGYVKNGKQVIEHASKFTDTLLVEGLINKEDFSFTIKSVNETPNARTEGAILTSNSVTPIRRLPDITYYPEELEKLSITSDMIDTYTQENSEGPKANLVDGDINTYWHSAWSSGVAPLPHWIEINNTEVSNLGAIKYWLRQNNGDKGGRPTQWGLETSEDGVTWERVWESDDNLSVSDSSIEHSVTFDKNYSATNFRVLILKDGSGTYAHLGEISFYKMDSRIVDKELEAEEVYYSF